MALEDVVVGTELSPVDFTWNEAAQRFELNLGAGFARGGDGPYTVDPATLAAIIAPLIDPAVLAPLVAPLIPATPANDGSRLVSHGFDVGNKTFTSGLQDGTQVVAGLPDIFTVPELNQRLRPLVSVSGRPVPNAMVFSAS